jgi:hypothetical protein
MITIFFLLLGCLAQGQIQKIIKRNAPVCVGLLACPTTLEDGVGVTTQLLRASRFPKHP